MTTKSIQERLEAKYIPEPNTGCWIWLGGMNTEGRALLGSKTAARISYSAYKKPIPEGLSVLHKCDEPICINPDHLFLGTQTDNMRDMARKGRRCWKREGSGICQDKRTQKWRAYFYEGGRQHHIGVFASRDEAISARYKALNS